MQCTQSSCAGGVQAPGRILPVAPGWLMRTACWLAAACCSAGLAGDLPGASMWLLNAAACCAAAHSRSSAPHF
jgi:hypothetical protein